MSEGPQPPATGKITRGTPQYRALSLAMLIAGLGTFSLLYCVQPLLPLFSRTFDLNAEAASLAVSLTVGPLALALLGAGAVSDRLGRRPLMIGSLFAAAILTVLPALWPSWPTLLVLRALTGFAAAGVPAVAMTYIVEEVEDGAVGHAMGLYIAGTAIGGMSGRLLGGFVADVAGWRGAMAAVGGVVLLLAVLFARRLPPSRHFATRRSSLASYAEGLRRLARDKAIGWLVLEAFLLMGAFVTIYNYASYRLLAAPYSLSQAAVSAIFGLYLVGSVSSAWAGAAASRLGARRTLWLLLALFGVGVALTAAEPLPMVILGIAVVTAGFFGAHSIASAWIARRARADRAQASSAYLFAYYMGAGVLGSAGGFAWTHGGWPGVVVFTGALVGAGFLVSLRLAQVRPLPPSA